MRVWEKFWRQNASSQDGGSTAKILRDFFIDIMLARQVQRKRVPELGSAEPEGAVVLNCLS